MSSALEDSLTVWLARLRDGRPDALEHVVSLVYDELRGIARRQLSHERPPHALSATTLVHETYLRLLQDALFLAGSRRDADGHQLFEGVARSRGA